MGRLNDNFVGKLQRELEGWIRVFGHLGATPDEVGNILIEEMDRLRASYPEWIVPDLTSGHDLHSTIPKAEEYILFKVKGDDAVRYGSRERSPTIVIVDRVWQSRFHISLISAWIPAPKETAGIEARVNAHNWIWVDETGEVCLGTSPHKDFISVPLTASTIAKGDLYDLMLRQVKENPQMYRELNAVFPTMNLRPNLESNHD